MQVQKTKTQKIEEIEDIINNPCWTEKYYRFSPFPSCPVCTAGVIQLAEAAGCYWLLDIIGSYQYSRKLDKAFQIWTLEVYDEKTAKKEKCAAVVKGFNDKELIIKQKIPFTDFPLEKLKLYLMDSVILLPSEY
jgi:hypothetical protein